MAAMLRPWVVALDDRIIVDADTPDAVELASIGVVASAERGLTFSAALEYRRTHKCVARPRELDDGPALVSVDPSRAIGVLRLASFSPTPVLRKLALKAFTSNP